MTETTLQNDPRFLVKAITKAIETEVEREFDEEIKKLTKRIQERKQHIVGGIMVSLSKHISMQTMGDIIRVEINTKNL